MTQIHSFKEFLKTLIARGKQKEQKPVQSNKNAEAFKLNQKFSLSIIGIANSVELFKGEVGKGGTMQVARQSCADTSNDEQEEEVKGQEGYLLR